MKILTHYFHLECFLWLTSTTSKGNRKMKGIKMFSIPASLLSEAIRWSGCIAFFFCSAAELHWPHPWTCTRNGVDIQWKANSSRVRMWRWKSSWQEKFCKFSPLKCQNMFDGNKTIQLGGMAFLIVIYHIKLVSQERPMPFHFEIFHAVFQNTSSSIFHSDYPPKKRFFKTFNLLEVAIFTVFFFFPSAKLPCKTRWPVLISSLLLLFV